MKYYSEDDVMDLIREAEDCERAYEWGEGHRRIHFEDYNPIEIPDKHGDLIDRMELAMNVAKAQEEIKGKDIDPFMLLGDVLRWIALAPTIVEASNE